MLLATDCEGMTVFHVAAQLGTPEILQKLREWAEKTRITEEVYNKLLATDKKKRTTWNVAAEQGKLDRPL